VSADYPLMLRLAGRRCVVVGGGSVARRKIEGLIVGEADIVVVAPDVQPEIEDFAKAGTLLLERRAFQPSDLDDAVLAFAATNDRDVNQIVADAAFVRGVLVNVADDPAACDFTVPSVVHRGDVTLTASTGGRSPAFARFLREQLDLWLTDERVGLLDLSTELRRQLRATETSIDAASWRRALADPTVEWALAAGDRDEARRRLLALLFHGA
jgi:precorrin-2 dehydrogenase/sirohydrochlorin ferrochelatase